MINKYRTVSFYSWTRLVLPCFVVLLLSSNLWAQEYQPETTSPYNTIFTHLFFLQPDSYQPEFAALAIDPDAVADSLERIERAIQLKQILDGEGLFVNLEKLPRQFNFVDSTKGESEYSLFPESKPQIYLIKKGENWYYSPQTVQLIPVLHKSLFPFGSTFLMNLAPTFGHHTFLGLAVWQYFGILLIGIFSLLLYYLIHQILRPFVRRLLRSWLNEDEEKQITLIDRLTSALSILLNLQILRYALPMLLLPIEVGAMTTLIIKILQAICIAWVFIRLINFFKFYLESVVGRTSNKMDDQLLPLMSKMFHLIIYLGALIHILHLLDVNITALIAGVSIGGLAIALAAQDAVKNFIGSIMIFTDKPFQIGDYIVGSSFEGVVEEVGFRTTRIKALDTSIIAVPNGLIANMNIENKGVRIMRLFNTTLGMTYDSKAEQLKSYITDLIELIIDHPRISNENYYVHLKEMASSSINIMFRAYLDVPAYADELAIKEEIIYRMIELAERNGLDFAFPTQTIHQG